MGNIGPKAALPVMEGKALLFKEFGGVDAFPICLDTQDVDRIVDTCTFLAPTFGGINLEDISSPRCIEIEERLASQVDIPVFHDDQHGTAIVVMAALRNALRVSASSRRLSASRSTGPEQRGSQPQSCCCHRESAKSLSAIAAVRSTEAGLEHEPIKTMGRRNTNQDLIRGSLMEAIPAGIFYRRIGSQCTDRVAHPTNGVRRNRLRPGKPRPGSPS